MGTMMKVVGMRSMGVQGDRVPDGVMGLRLLEWIVRRITNCHRTVSCSMNYPMAKLTNTEDSAKMPRPPPAVYDPCVAQHTESVTPPAVSAPVAPGVAPPQYTETPIVRVL